MAWRFAAGPWPNEAGNNINIHNWPKGEKVATVSTKFDQIKTGKWADPPSIAPNAVYFSLMIPLIFIMIKRWLWDLLDPVACSHELFHHL